eukprot:3158133-Rhodomonas_salina.1
MIMGAIPITNRNGYSALPETTADFDMGPTIETLEPPSTLDPQPQALTPFTTANLQSQALPQPSWTTSDGARALSGARRNQWRSPYALYQECGSSQLISGEQSASVDAKAWVEKWTEAVVEAASKVGLERERRV